ncbi:sensor histidine kinase [Streptococcus parauberis]|uniref:sensor histidine kinase n=1 Tax=Streptococcus parauberis TaxID=1348 RepID=UPI000789ADF2|nr:histidine kinase [Streptococcus parauberis]KYP21133.1 putative sensor-like histidine kinase [Streptococcus parauberis]KYP21517.1 putative sensor-like histidine kinase [Streptococcus parauberis]KYP22087.1 putative sensor-like histidine kinase [Streptococcus parauberis]KYP22831.1 putative sensor-like histidine kinase [Streptococcus parauberis]KYP25176.1 putative sensor-like histidine kinase [Streptococcus parauberis]
MVIKKEIADNSLSFQDKIRMELLGGLKKTTFFIVLSYLFVLSLFLLLMQYSQLHQSESTIISYYERIDQSSGQLVNHLSQRGLTRFLKGKLAEREMYRQVYEESHKIPIRTAVSVYSPKKKLLLSTKLPSRDGLSDDSFVRIALNNIKSKSVYKIFRDSQGNRYLLKLVPIRNQDKIEGYIVLFMDSSDFQFGINSEATQYILADNFDNYFASNSLKYVSEDKRKLSQSFAGSYFLLDDSRLYLTKQHQLTESLYLYTYILAYPIDSLLLITFMFMAIIMVILLFYSKQLVRKISIHSSDSIEQLTTDLNLIMNGYKDRVSVRTSDEFGYLANNINKMIDTLERIFKQTIQLEQEKTQFERRLLEAQFNPHFLYNALESIKILVFLDPEKAEQMILALTKVLRYSITSNAEMATLADDLDIIDSYLAVNQVRFDELDYQISYQDDLASLPIPKLFLLPLVENALKYGMRDRHDLSILIEVREVAGFIEMTVCDDGAGFSDIFLANFDSYLHDGATHHGLINSFHRLKHTYPKATIHIKKQNNLNCICLSFERSH